MGAQIKMLLILAILAAVTVGAKATMPFALQTFETPDEIKLDDNYRLKHTLKDIHYDITITLDDKGETFKTVTIIKFTPDGFTNNKLLLHLSPNTNPPTARIVKADDETVDLYTGAKELENEYEIIEYTIKDPQFDDVAYKLTVTYDGILQSELHGFYKTHYKNGLYNEYIFATHFEPTHARKLFPCFDEPSYKAKFKLTVKHPKGYTAISNTLGTPTADGLSTAFAETPLMSTYLLAIVVTKFGKYPPNPDPNPHAIWAQPKYSEDSKTYALRNSPSVLNTMKEFTDKNFNTMGIGKVDHVALPDFSAGAMENWGLVTYRESVLLYDGDESSAASKMRALTVLTHELAHFWFGNFKTTAWWDTIWLNEGFARYFQYMAAHAIETEWELDNLFVVEQHFSIMNPDAITPKALNLDVDSPQSIKEKFDSFSYNKGASIIRMMSLFADSTDGLKNGLIEYMGNLKTNMVPSDLWEAMHGLISNTNSPKIDEIMKSYTDQGGLPLLVVERKDKEVTITQRQFLFDKPEKPEDLKVYYVPISYTTESESRKLDFKDTKPKGWVLSKNPQGYSFQLENANSLYLINIQASAYARVKYPDEDLERIRAALSTEDYLKIHVLNRVQLVEDAFALARSEDMDYSKALKFISYLKNEVSYFPWYSAFRAFDYILSKLPHDSAVAKQLKLLILALMEKVYTTKNIPNEKQHITELKRSLTTSWRCNLGDPKCIEDMQALYQMIEKNAKTDPNLRGTAYCVALRQSEGRETWDKVITKYVETNIASEAHLILPALGCTKVTENIEWYLTESLDSNSKIIRKQDRRSIFTYVLNGNPTNVEIVGEFYIRKYDDIKTSFLIGDRIFIATEILGRLTANADIEKYKKLWADKDAELSPKLSAAINRANKNLNLMEKSKNAILKYSEEFFKPDNGNNDKPNKPNDPDSAAGSIIASFLFILCSTFIVLYL